ncbi:MAG: PKD domain-containing protein [Kiritimatiellae bacterium]|nr:PKD domain-containing protein [Kiritimatiellia bacterium]
MNSWFAGNQAPSGGGAYGSTLWNCTLTGNSATQTGGGAEACVLCNCIVYYNTAGRAANWDEGSLTNCCTVPLPVGQGNIAAEPRLASASHLGVGSPCIGAGSTLYATGADIDGDVWASPPSIGCDEAGGGVLTGELSVAASVTYDEVAVGATVEFRADIRGAASASAWDFTDGTVVSNRLRAGHAFASAGDYSVILTAYNGTYPGGLSATVTVHVAEQMIHYVSAASVSPSSPFRSWTNAATTIQDAVDAALQVGALVLVSNGVYDADGGVVYGEMSNRVAICKPITVRSTGGPDESFIVGRGPQGNGAVRGAYIGTHAMLIGFTLTNGHTLASGDVEGERSGGGVWCDTQGAVSNCVLVGNSASYGGGAFGGTLCDCTMAGNSAQYGGGTYESVLDECLLTGNSAQHGGAAFGGTLRACVLSGNRADTGGGVADGVLEACRLAGNSAASGGGVAGCALLNCALWDNDAQFGGGSFASTLQNCTLTGNRAAACGGGSYTGTLHNSIVYYNDAATCPNWGNDILRYCCTTPLPAGQGNIADEPRLASAYHLSDDSSCVGAGSRGYASGTDIHGDSWADPPSMGCDEPRIGSVTGELSVAVWASCTQAVVGCAVEFEARVDGRVTATVWDFGDGAVVSNRAYAEHAYGAEGEYAVELRAYNETYPGGIPATVTVQVGAQTVHYVRADSSAPQTPFATWDTAATTIQDAVDAAVQGGALVLVSNGVYEAGGKVVHGALTNRVAIERAIAVQSVNGPEHTIIGGCGPNGVSAVRCAHVGSGAVLSGFTLTNGHTRSSGAWQDLYGGGLWCEPAGVVSNCVLSGNAAYSHGGAACYGALHECELAGNAAGAAGGGAYYATLHGGVLAGNSANYGGGAAYGALYDCLLACNQAYEGGGAYYSTLAACTLASNSASSRGGGVSRGTAYACTLAGNSATNSGGGAYGGTLNGSAIIGNWAPAGGGARAGMLGNCTLTGNSARDYGGGACDSTLRNCIVYGNDAPRSANWDGGALSYCCTRPLPDGAGNITDEPRLAGMYRLAADSPCIGAGSSPYATATDIDGEAWLNPPSTGCDEVRQGAVTGALSVAIWAAHTEVAAGFAVDFRAEIEGRLTASAWDFGDGTVLSNQPYAEHAFAATGDYPVILTAYNETFTGGTSASVTVHVVEQTVHYVSVESAGPAPPFASWDTAATNIQDAVDAATQVGALVLVSNGVYEAGGHAVYGTMTNRVVIDKPITVASLSGPDATTIAGHGPAGNAAVRCAYVGTNAALVGFTLTNGHTRTSGEQWLELTAGGAWCEASGMLSNCLLTACSAKNGGGTSCGRLYACTISGNSASSGGGAFCSILTDCTLCENTATNGGGAYYGTLAACALTGNSATYSGGGAYGGTLCDCTLSSNSAYTGGGGAYGGTLCDCTLSTNAAYIGGGGAHDSRLYDCTLSGNSSTHGGGGANQGTLYGCTLTGNWSDHGGGGVSAGTLHNCTLTGNSSTNRGGGAHYGTLYNCTLSGNSSTSGGAGGASWSTLYNCTVSGNGSDHGAGGTSYSTLYNCTVSANGSAHTAGGAYRGTLCNCIVQFNAPGGNWANAALDYCCTVPLPAGGVGNITGDPLFVDKDAHNYRLQIGSPCIDRGVNQDWVWDMTDLDGNPRVLNGTVDMGAYELPFRAAPRVLLEGPYDTNTHLMSHAQGSQAIPQSSPYVADSRAGEAPAGVVDWLLIELRDTNGHAVVCRSAWLGPDGCVLSDDGSTGLIVGVSAGQSYQLVLKHRNHLAVMSAEPLVITNQWIAYDFTTGSNQYWGGTDAAVELEPGVWGMIAGDADGDGEILEADARIHASQRQRAGYCRGDFNMDGIVRDDDVELFWFANEGRSTAVTNGGETFLSPALAISPVRVTVLAGASRTFCASGGGSDVLWAFVKNRSGGSLAAESGTSVVYQAGTTNSVVDVIQGWTTNGVLGRAYVNVLNPGDVTQVGKAIIVAGRKSADDSLWPVTDYLADSGYNTLLYRGFSKENVQYLSCVTNQDADGDGAFDDVDLETTHANAAESFTNWANQANRLFVYLVDHGGDAGGAGYFRLNPAETLTAAELDGWLDTLQGNWNTEVVVLLDFCYAGSFLDELSGTSNRIVIAACTDNQPTYFMAGGLASFSDAFFCGVMQGLNVEQCFGFAREAMSSHQQGWLDDNGDGVHEPGTDGGYAATQVIGASCVAGKDIPQIGSVCGNQLLTGDTTATLWADDVVSEYGIERVWCLVIPPSHEPNPEHPVSDVVELELTYNMETGRYDGRFDGFAEEGTYKVAYYAKDAWNSVSLPVQRYVTQVGFDERVVLVNGGLTNGAQWQKLDLLARRAYHTFLKRWFDGESVYYMSAAADQDLNGDGTNDVDAVPTLENLAFAITNWAGMTYAVTNEVDGSVTWIPADKLTVYLMGEDSEGVLSLNEAETLNAATLDSWLDEYQAAAQPPAIVVLEFDGSGGFMSDLTPPPDCERITLACTEPAKDCLWSGQGRVSFSGAFLSHIFNGVNLGEAFEGAKKCMRQASGQMRQRAQLDDDGDGLPNAPGQAWKRFLGSAHKTGADNPLIAHPMPETALKAETNAAVLWAADITDMDGVSNVWCTVTDPEYDGAGELPQAALTWNSAESRYELLYEAFTNLGAYVVTFFAEDNLGELSTPAQSVITHYEDTGDTDADGMLDGWEVQFFGGVTNADAETDSDGDTFNNWAEWLAGSDPTNAASMFELGSPAAPGAAAGVILSWPSLSNRVYMIDFTTNLVTVPFAPLVTNLPATPVENVYTDDQHSAEGQLYYRIRVGAEQ